MLDRQRPNSGGRGRSQTKTNSCRQSKATGIESGQTDDPLLAISRTDTHHTSNAASSHTGQGTSSRRPRRVDSSETCNLAELSSSKTYSFVQTSQPRFFLDKSVHDFKISTNQNHGNAEQKQSSDSKRTSRPRQHFRSSCQENSSDVFRSTKKEPGKDCGHQQRSHRYAQEGDVSPFEAHQTGCKYSRKTKRETHNFQNGKEEETEMAASRHPLCPNRRDERHPTLEVVSRAAGNQRKDRDNWLQTRRSQPHLTTGSGTRDSTLSVTRKTDTHLDPVSELPLKADSISDVIVHKSEQNAERNNTHRLLSEPKTVSTKISEPHLGPTHTNEAIPRSHHSNSLRKDLPCAQRVLPFSETRSVGNSVMESLTNLSGQLENCYHGYPETIVVEDRDTTKFTNSSQSLANAPRLFHSSIERNESAQFPMQHHSTNKSFLNAGADEFSPNSSTCYDTPDTTHLKQVSSSTNLGNQESIQNHTYHPQCYLVDSYGKAITSDLSISSLETQPPQMVWSYTSPYAYPNVNYINPCQNVYSPSMPMSYSCFPPHAPGFVSTNQPHQVSQDSSASSQCPLCLSFNPQAYKTNNVAHNPFFDKTTEMTPTFVPTVPVPSQPATVQPPPGYTVYLPMYASASPFTPSVNLPEATHCSGSYPKPSTTTTTPIFSVTPQYNSSAQLVCFLPDSSPSYAFQAASGREPVFNLQKHFKSATEEIAENIIDTNTDYRDGFLTSLKSDKNIQVDVSSSVEYVEYPNSQGNNIPTQCQVSEGHTTEQYKTKLTSTSCSPIELQNLPSTVASKLSKDDKAMFEECKRLLGRLACKKVSVDWLHSRVSTEQGKQRRAMMEWLRLALQVIQEKGQSLTLDEMVAVMLEPTLRQELKC